MCVVQPVASVDVVLSVTVCQLPGLPKQPTPVSVPLSSSSVGVDIASHCHLTCLRGLIIINLGNEPPWPKKTVKLSFYHGSGTIQTYWHITMD